MANPLLTSRLEEFRSLRAEVEASIRPQATSLDGRRFTFQAPIDGLALRLGGYVVMERSGRSSLGQVRSLEAAEVDAGAVALPPVEAGGADVRARLPIRLARGHGGGARPRRGAVPRPGGAPGGGG